LTEDPISRPIINPDPTPLTTQALWREIAALKELFETRLQAVETGIEVAHGDLVRFPTEVQKQIANLKELHDSKILCNEHEVGLIRQVIETRLDGMDKAMQLLQAIADAFPARIDEKIQSLEKVHEEKFRSIGVQFVERDTRTEQTSRDSKVAVDAALQAAKEAVGEQNRSSALAIAKSEAATAKQIDQQGLLISTTAKASDEKIDDLKERLTRIEGTGTGAAGARATQQTSNSFMVAVVFGFCGVLLGIVTLIARFAGR